MADQQQTEMINIAADAGNTNPSSDAAAVAAATSPLKKSPGKKKVKAVAFQADVEEITPRTAAANAAAAAAASGSAPKRVGFSDEKETKEVVKVEKKAGEVQTVDGETKNWNEAFESRRKQLSEEQSQAFLDDIGAWVSNGALFRWR